MILQVGRQALSETLLSSLAQSGLISLLNWKFRLYHKSGGLKKQWFWGANNPFKSIDFELNKKLMGAGSFELNYLDFPIHAGDYFEVYYKGELKYKALVDTSIDPKGGKVKLVPYSQQFQELLTDDTVLGVTIPFIFQSTIELIEADTNIHWNDYYVDINSDFESSTNYKYTQPRKIFDDLIVKCDDRDWGVNQYNLFCVYEMESNVSVNLLNTDTPHFESIEEKIDYSLINATRYQVEAKTDGVAEVTRIGQVGYGTGYDILTDIESKVRKKVEKYQVPEVISTTSEALDIAYADLVWKARINNPVSVKGLDPDFYFPVIGKKVKAESKPEQIMKIICDCDSLVGWSGYVSTTSTYYTEGDGAITFSGSASPTSIVFDLGEYKKYLSPTKIGFMLRTSCSGDFLEFSLARYQNGVTGNSICGRGICSQGISQGSDYLWETTKKIHIGTGSVWNYFDFDLTDTDFRYFGLRFFDVPFITPCSVWIDEIQIFAYDKKIYEGNIVSAKFKFNENGIKCDVELNDYNKFANDKVFYYEQKIKKLEAIVNGDV